MPTLWMTPNQLLHYKSHIAVRKLVLHYQNARAVGQSHTLEATPSVQHMAKPVAIAKKLVFMPEYVVQSQ